MACTPWLQQYTVQQNTDSTFACDSEEDYITDIPFNEFNRLVLECPGPSNRMCYNLFATINMFLTQLRAKGIPRDYNNSPVSADAFRFIAERCLAIIDNRPDIAQTEMQQICPNCDLLWLKVAIFQADAAMQDPANQLVYQGYYLYPGHAMDEFNSQKDRQRQMIRDMDDLSEEERQAQLASLDEYLLPTPSTFDGYVFDSATFVKDPFGYLEIWEQIVQNPTFFQDLDYITPWMVVVAYFKNLQRATFTETSANYTLFVNKNIMMTDNEEVLMQAFTSMEFMLQENTWLKITNLVIQYGYTYFLQDYHYATFKINIEFIYGLIDTFQEIEFQQCPIIALPHLICVYTNPTYKYTIIDSLRTPTPALPEAGRPVAIDDQFNVQALVIKQNTYTTMFDQDLPDYPLVIATVTEIAAMIEAVPMTAGLLSVKLPDFEHPREARFIAQSIQQLTNKLRSPKVSIDASFVRSSILSLQRFPLPAFVTHLYISVEAAASETLAVFLDNNTTLRAITVNVTYYYYYVFTLEQLLDTIDLQQIIDCLNRKRMLGLSTRLVATNMENNTALTII